MVVRIHPGQFHASPRERSRGAAGWPTFLLLTALGLCSAVPLAAQSGTPEPEAELPSDSTDLLSVARAAQDLFERRRIPHLPVRIGGGSGGDCDEIVGRFCTWFSEGEWYPTPEAPEIIQLRGELLYQLDEIHRLLPGDAWLLGQRVWYRTQAGLRDDAVSVAGACGLPDRWWCSALEGFALHELDRFEEAERAFARALEEMGPERARLWRVPRRAVQPSVRRVLDRAAQVSDDSLSVVLDRVWVLADPLYLVDGNDRLTSHYARWTVATLHEDMRNPHKMRWGRDLEELTVRNGWSIGWERTPPRDLSTLDQMTGHMHPESRDFMPPGVAILDPGVAESDDLVADRTSPASMYAPAYAPVLLPMEGQLAVFPRIGETAVVATFALPEDTTFHSDHDHEIPWLEPGDQADMPDRVGLFAVSAATGAVSGLQATSRTEGGLMLTVAPDTYILSAEVWSPSSRRAGRLRRGTPIRVAAEDVATLSDLVLTRHVEEPPPTLRSAVAELLPGPRIGVGEPFGVGWEVAGLGFRPEALSFDVSVERVDRNVLRRLGDFLRVTSRPRPLELSWEEPGPERPETVFRHLNLDVPDLEPGRYEITLTLRTATRSPTSSRLRFEVVRGER